MQTHGQAIRVDLKELYRCIGKWSVDGAHKCWRRACQLARAEHPDLSNEVGALLAAFAEDGSDAEALLCGDRFAATRDIAGIYFKKAQQLIQDEEAMRLKKPVNEPWLDDYFVERLFTVAEQKIVGFYHNKLYQGYAFVEYYKYLAGHSSNGSFLKEPVEFLAREGYGDEMLKELWANCPVEAAGRGLPMLPGVLTNGELRVWEALDQRALKGEELASVVNTSSQTIKEHVKSIKSKGFPIDNQRGRGYFRLDRPPSATVLR